MSDFNMQDHLRDMEARLMAAIVAEREVTKDLRSDLESYAASFVAHEQRIIAVERMTATARYISYASLAALGGLVFDVLRTKVLAMIQ